MKPKQQYDKFLEHVRQSTTKFTLKRSSLKPLFAILDDQLKKKAFAALDRAAVTKALGKDKRLAKYQAAIDTLIGVWGTDQDYVIPKAPPQGRGSAATPPNMLGEEDDGSLLGKPLSVKDMSCHTWAMSGTPAKAEKMNEDYVNLMNKIGAHHGYGYDLKEPLAAARQKTMVAIGNLCEKRTNALDHEVWVCGGFREGQVCPEHLWLEDHTTKKSYDTFINQNVRVVNKVGKPGKPFQPGCEGSPFKGDEIGRVQVNGFTKAQFDVLDDAEVSD